MGGKSSIQVADEKYIQTERKKNTWRPRHRWEDNTEMDLKKSGVRDADKIQVVQD
jgi:hypothetical protein